MKEWMWTLIRVALFIGIGHWFNLETWQFGIAMGLIWFLGFIEGVELCRR
jgi:hypothetical protein